MTQLHETFILHLRSEEPSSGGEQLLTTACQGLILPHELPSLFLELDGDRLFIDIGEKLLMIHAAKRLAACPMSVWLPSQV